jgi:GNAT superfamily N-acetyltransferase
MKVDPGMPSGVRSLVWDVFFKSRGRGESLLAHFPWIDRPDGFHTLWLQAPDEPERAIAALVIKPGPWGQHGRAALLGLVCVHPDWRGQGLSADLLQEVMHVAHDLGFRALVLWTQMPALYENWGFASVAQERLLQVRGVVNLTLPLSVVEQDVTLPEGLPPFALSAQRWQTSAAQAVVLQMPGGMALADWCGPSVAVAHLLMATMPAVWLLNALPQDDLPEVLVGMGCECSPVPGAHRMVLAWDEAKVPLAGVEFDRVSMALAPCRLLHRI